MQGLIQLVVKNVNEKNVPFKITGYSRNPKLEFAEFRSNETYIKVWFYFTSPYSPRGPQIRENGGGCY